MRALLMLWILVLAGTVPVRALAVSVTFCAEYRTDYDDSDLALNDPAAEGDYFATNSDKVARGALIRTIRNSDGLTSELYAEWTGTDAGCAGPFTLTDGEQYDVQIIGEALVRDNTIKVMNNQDDRARWFSVALDDWTAPTTTTTEPIVTANTHDAWNVAAAAGHAMWRRGGGVSNKTFDFFTQYDQCDVGETDCDRRRGGGPGDPRRPRAQRRARVQLGVPGDVDGDGDGARPRRTNGPPRERRAH